MISIATVYLGVLATAVGPAKVMRVLIADDNVLVREGIASILPDAGYEGVRAAVAIRDAAPATGVLVLSQYVQRQYALQQLTDQQREVLALMAEGFDDTHPSSDDSLK